MNVPITKLILSLIFISSTVLYAQKAEVEKNVVAFTEGRLEGKTLKSGVVVFKGVPYAMPPLGNLRWKAPVPMAKWNGVRPAFDFGPRPMQKSNIMYEFRSKKSSEDCLYLNIWSPLLKKSPNLKPVYVFIHGGSFVRGDGSQPAYDGESMATEGIVYVSINYRLGVFGFMAHPELSKESGHGSGNYGLLDQVAALKWIKENISAFGGDPNSITIGGESVGAQSATAHMVSSLSKQLFNRVIAESGSIVDNRKVINSLEQAESLGVAVSEAAKADNIAALRSLTASKILKIASKGNPRRFIPAIDGYFFKEDPAISFAKGRQAQVPLLTGWNANEVPSFALFRLRRATKANYDKALTRLYGAKADEVAALYPSAESKQEMKLAGAEVISDYAINFSSWNLADIQASANTAPVYRYLFAHPHPGLSDYQLDRGNIFQILLKKMINRIIKGSSFHAAEIEYALGNLGVQPNFDWADDDFEVSAQFKAYFVNFIKTGNPNNASSKGLKLVQWPQLVPGEGGQYLKIGKISYAQRDSLRTRYLKLRKIVSGN
jgi:para-nitrobenzyl esterase